MNVTEKREVAYADEAIVDPEHSDQHMVAWVTEGEAGYGATTYTGSIEYVKAVADSINESRGHDRETVMAVVGSSMRAGNFA